MHLSVLFCFLLILSTLRDAPFWSVNTPSRCHAVQEPPKIPPLCFPLAVRSGLPEAIICFLSFHMQIHLPSASMLPQLPRHLCWCIASAKRTWGLENGHFTDARAVRCTSKHFSCWEREAGSARRCRCLYFVIYHACPHSVLAARSQSESLGCFLKETKMRMSLKNVEIV